VVDSLTQVLCTSAAKIVASYCYELQRTVKDTAVPRSTGAVPKFVGATPGRQKIRDACSGKCKKFSSSENRVDLMLVPLSFLSKNLGAFPLVKAM
jgi:hypothetical protein